MSQDTLTVRVTVWLISRAVFFGHAFFMAIRCPTFATWTIRVGMYVATYFGILRAAWITYSPFPTIAWRGLADVCMWAVFTGYTFMWFPAGVWESVINFIAIPDMEYAIVSLFYIFGWAFWIWLFVDMEKKRKAGKLHQLTIKWKKRFVPAVIRAEQQRLRAHIVVNT